MKEYYPRLRLNEAICKENISKIADRAKQSEVSFRPHFKTHQAAEIGTWFRQAGVNKITVSSLKMAHYFAKAGWQDIFIAFPVNLLEAKEIELLASQVKLSLSIDSAEIGAELVSLINQHADVYIKIDTGYHRSGILSSDIESIDGILKALKKSTNINFKGFYTHSGHTYNTSSTTEIKAIYKDAVTKLNTLKQYYQAQFPDLILSIGDTPSSSVLEDYGRVDEIRPGNFVFYDLMQVGLGACHEENIAIALECPVVSISESRNEVVIHGGAVHLSKEFLSDGSSKLYGKVVMMHEKGWSPSLPDTFLKGLSQEHGIIQATRQNMERFKKTKKVGILPVHSCLTANLSEMYLTLDDKLLGKMRS